MSRGDYSEGARVEHCGRDDAARDDGYGAASRIHTAKILRLSEDLPVVVEIVDSAEKIATLLPFIDEMVEEGLVTLEDIRVIQYRGPRAP